MILFTSAMAEALILVPPSPSVHCTNVNASSNQAPNKIWALRIFSVGPFHKLKISKCAWRVKPFYMDLQQSCLAYASTSSNSEETFVDVDLSDPSAKGASKDELLKTSEPKWKQKLAAADEHAERVRQLTLQAEKEYKNRQMLLQQERGIGFHDVVPLNELEFLTYLTEEGIINDCGEVDAKATVYAVFDEQKNLQYVGITRQVYHSMRLHFARVPKKCFYVKILHVSRPNRLLLERIRTAWIVENGGAPMGNDNGPHQNIWENPLDCKPLMTEEEEQKFKEVPAGPVQAKFLKDVARRIEKGILAGFAERNCKEKLWFDPKLKEKGLLDLKNEKTQLDACVPTTNFKLASTTKT